MRNTHLMTPMEDVTCGRPSADRTSRFVTDQQIRVCGYKIHSRPKKGEPIWEKDGLVFPQSAVIEIERLDR